MSITVGCNDTITTDSGDLVNAVKLLYNCQYSMVVLDAEKILTQYEDEHRFSISNLSHCAQRIYFAPKIELTKEEKNQAFVVRVCFQKHKSEQEAKKYAVRYIKPKGKQGIGVEYNP